MIAPCARVASARRAIIRIARHQGRDQLVENYAPLLRNAGGNNSYCTPEGIVQVWRNITIARQQLLGEDGLGLPRLSMRVQATVASSE